MRRKAKYLLKPLNWLLKQARRMRSTQTAQEKNAASRQPNQPATPSKSTFHQSIETLPYKTFLDIHITGNLDLLTIEGTADPMALVLSWNEILMEYSDAIKTKKSSTLFQLSRKILKNNWLIKLVDDCVLILKYGYDEQVANVLYEQGYSLVQNLPDREQYLKQIYRVQTEAKILIVLQNQYNIEYKTLNPVGAPPQARSMVDYEKELRILSKFMGYSIRSHQITTMEFVSILNAYLEYSETLKEAENE